MNSPRQPVEQFRMRRRRALRAEIFLGLDEAAAEVAHPDAVHRHARRERVFGTDEPAGQVEPRARSRPAAARAAPASSTSGVQRADVLVRPQKVAAQADVTSRRGWSSSFHDHQLDRVGLRPSPRRLAAARHRLRLARTPRATSFACSARALLGGDRAARPAAAHRPRRLRRRRFRCQIDRKAADQVVLVQRRGTACTSSGWPARSAAASSRTKDRLVIGIHLGRLAVADVDRPAASSDRRRSRPATG